MLIFKYKKCFFLLFILAFALATNAQQNHFVYLQTDNGSPFYIKLNNRILSSSAEGYIILPDIVSGVYQLKVGFPKKEYPEESFSVSVGDENEGYLIKHFDDKGLQLFNLETLALISGNSDSVSQMAASPSKDNNPFTTMLANVVRDSTILQNHEVVVDNPFKKADTSKADNEVAADLVPPANTAVPDSATSFPATNSADSGTTNPANTFSSNTLADTSAVASSGSPISKLLSKQDKDGLQMVYSDATGKDKDTVSVFMPSGNDQPTADSEATKKENFDFTAGTNTANNSAANASPDTSLTITPTVIKPENKKPGFVLRKDTITTAADSVGIGKTAATQVFYIGPKEKEKNRDTSQKTSAEEKKGLFSGLSKPPKKEPEEINKPAANKIEVLPNEAAPSNSNSDCKAFADNEDFLRLRKKMVSQDTREGMIKVANKYFRSKCFSTSQIKDLSYLFLTDEGKYMFFDAAYAHTSDSDQYSTLDSQLKDPYYKKRFEALIGK